MGSPGCWWRSVCVCVCVCVCLSVCLFVYGEPLAGDKLFSLGTSAGAEIHSPSPLYAGHVHFISIFRAHVNIRGHACAEGVHMCDHAHKNMGLCAGSHVCMCGGAADLFGGFFGSTFIPLLLWAAPGHPSLGPQAGGGNGHPALWTISPALCPAWVMTAHHRF